MIQAPIGACRARPGERRQSDTRISETRKSETHKSVKFSNMFG